MGYGSGGGIQGCSTTSFSDPGSETQHMFSKVILDNDTQLEIGKERKWRMLAGEAGGAGWRVRYLKWTIWKNYSVSI